MELEASDIVRLSVNVSGENWDGIEALMAREGLTETQAVHRVLWYGLFVYRTIAVEQKKIVIHDGSSRNRIRLVHDEHIPPDSESDSANKK